MKSFFIDFFPPPDYLSMPAVGLDISDLSIKYAELMRKDGDIAIRNFGEMLMPAGMIEAGEIKDKEKLIEFLKPLKKEFKSKYIISCLPEEKAFLAKFEIPIMKDEDIKSALEMQIEENVPLTSQEAIFDFDVIKGAPDSNHFDIFMIAFHKNTVNDYTEVFTGAGFEPLVFEMEVQAAARTMVPKGEKGALILVDFGRTRTSMAIVSDGQVYFSSTLRVAGQEIDKMLMKNLGVDQFQAEKIKKEQGFTKDNEKIFNSILPIVSVIKDEVGKAIDYWNSRVKNDQAKKISKILLCGGDSNLFGFSEYISYELKLPVELGNPWVNILSFDKHIPEIELKDALKYATALGLALREARYE